MPKTTIRFSTFPRTIPPPEFVRSVVDVFAAHESQIATAERKTELKSDRVLAILHDGLVELGFDVEAGKRQSQKINRPVFFGENGAPRLQYEIDAYHPEWRCGLEIEAGRAWKGNAIYRDMIQALIMVQVDFLILAVANKYRYKMNGRAVASPDYENTVSVADAVFGHTRFTFPYNLAVIGY